MEKKELKEEIKKVLEGKSIYEMSPISGLNPMTKEEIIYWIVETYIDQELDKAREEVQFTKEELECILKWKDACDGEFNGMTLLPASGEDWGKEEDIENAEDKLEEMLSKLKDNK